MNLQDSVEASVEVDGGVGCITAVGASVFGRPVWPSAYHDFVHAIDRVAWVRDRLMRADFELVAVPEDGAYMFLREVMTRVESSWHLYAVPKDQRDNTLAALALLHLPVKCVVMPHGGGEDDVEEEVRVNSL